MKALFFDLDGTLLTSRQTLSPLTRTALEGCRERGINLFVATARSPLLPRMLSWDRKTMSLFKGGSYYNGGCILVGKFKEYITVPQEVVSKALALVSRYPRLNAALQLEGEWQTFRFPLADAACAAWGITPKELLPLDRAKEFRTVKLLIFYKSLIDSTTPVSPALVLELEALCQNQAQFYLTDHGKTVQIMGPDVNKQAGVRRICELFGYEKGEIAVFGDDINDLEMLAEYPNSFAMGNASDVVRAAAHFTIPDNDHDGIAYAITELMRL